MTLSNWPTILAGLKANQSQLVPTDLKQVLDYEPNQISGGASPLVYFILKDLKLTPPTNQEQEVVYSVGMRLVVQYTNNQTAEQTVAALIPTVLNTLGHDLDCGESIQDGQVTITGGVAGYLTIGATRYRIVDFTLEIVERVSFDWSL